MEKITDLLQKHKQFLLYCICGGSGVCADYAVFYIFKQEFGVWYQVANASGYIAGTLLSSILNRAITFNMRDKTGQRLALFLTTAAIGFGASAGMLWLLVDYVYLDARIAKLLTLPMVVILQFTLNKRFTFQPTKIIS
jgi:putative flippase GtrA